MADRVVNDNFRLIVDNLGEGVLIAVGEKPVYVNRRLVKIFKFQRPDEILDLSSYFQLVAPKDHQQVPDYAKDRAAGGTPPSEYEIEGICADGSAVFILNNPVLIKWGGEPAVLATISDISERKTAETKLRDSERRYQQIADTQTELITQFSFDGAFTYVNRSYCDFVGKTKPQLTGTSIFKHIPEDDLVVLRSHLSSFTPINRIQQSSNRLMRHDGELRDFEWSNSAHFDDDDQLLGFQSVGRDITERMQIEAALQAKESQYAAVVDGQAELITRFEPDGKITFVNATYCRFVGKAEKEVLDATIFDDVPETETQKLKDYLASFSMDATVQQITNKLHRFDGQLRDLEWTNTAFFDAEGRLVEFQSSARDVTERKFAERILQDSETRLRQKMLELQDREQRLQAQAIELTELADSLSKSNEALDQANTQKDKLFSIIAHDLRGPFTTLLGYSRIFSSSIKLLSPERIAKTADDMSRAAERVYGLLDNLLEWSRLQLEGTEFDPNPLDLPGSIAESMELFQPLAKDKNIELIGPSAAKIIVFADPHMVTALVRNLLNNAIKFTERGGEIQIMISQQANFAAVDVKDTGVGMDAEKLTKLFALGENTSTPGTNGERGTGLGLHLCRDLVIKNGGELSVSSEEGTGTTFRFTLPLAS